VVERDGAAFRAGPLAWGPGGLPAGITLTALNLEQAGRLAQALRPLADALRADVDGQFAAIRAAHRQAHPFKFRLYDLAGFCRVLAGHPAAAPAAVAAAHGVLAALADQELVLAEDHSSPAYDGIGGLSIYLLSQEPGKAPSPYYTETTYAQETGWGEFLKAYYSTAL
jgi:hypothetical protein